MSEQMEISDMHWKCSCGVTGDGWDSMSDHYDECEDRDNG